MWMPAYIGLGSNLDDPPTQLTRASEALRSLQGCRWVVESPRYGSDPVGHKEQPRFLNGVVVLLTELSAASLHEALQALEVRLGKVPPRERFGPRRIDLDLLAFGGQVIQTETLQVPHPRLHERAFVLYPLNDVAPDLWIPGHGRIRTLKSRLGAEGLSLQ